MQYFYIVYTTCHIIGRSYGIQKWIDVFPNHFVGFIDFKDHNMVANTKKCYY